jgi:hypothetical protein
MVKYFSQRLECNKWQAKYAFDILTRKCAVLWNSVQFSSLVFLFLAVYTRRRKGTKRM